MNARVKKFLLIALALASAQIGIAWISSPAPDLGQSYLRFCTWDCGWYRGITETGYHSTIPPVRENGALANVAFFPGYPMIARALYLTTHLDARIALLLVAQVFCVAFWLVLLLILERWKVHPYVRAIAVLSVFVHPAAFFLVMGYSESLFLASLLFFIYWADDENPRRQWLATIPGFLMTATRIVGVPVAAYPVFRFITMQGWAGLRQRRIIKPLAIAAVSSLGCLAFLAYCQVRFGDFQLYMKTQRIGWGIVPDYGALWKWSDFNYILPYEQVATIASGIGLASILTAELGWAGFSRSRPNATRMPIYLCACLIFYITLSGLKSLWFRSMIRYTLPWWVLIVLCLAQLSTRLPRLSLSKSRIALAIGVAALAVFCYFYQFPFLIRFLNGNWFA